MPSRPNLMRAVIQRAYGTSALAVSERSIPDAAPGQIRIRVSAGSLNPMDWHLAAGSPRIVRLAEGFRRPKHQIPGREASGVIDQLGEGVTDFEIGQRVFGWLTGGYAEYAVAESSTMCVAPHSMNEFETAVLPIAGTAAVQAVELGDVKDKRVVVNGASGGVGHYLVQVAKAAGASWVAGVTSGRNAGFVRSLGADQVIDYETQDFTSEQWDVVIDCIGNRTGSEIRSTLSDNGRWIVVGDHDNAGLVGPLPRLLARLIRWRFGSKSCHWFVQGEDVRYLQELAGLVDDGAVRSHLTEIVPLVEVERGYDQIASGRTVGKMSVDVAMTEGPHWRQLETELGVQA